MQLYEWLKTIGTVIEGKGALDWELPFEFENEQYRIRVIVGSYCRLADNMDYPVVLIDDFRPVGMLEMGEPWEATEYRRIILKATCWNVKEPKGDQGVEQLVLKLVRFDAETWNIVLCNRCLLWYSDTLREWIERELHEGFRRAIGDE